MKRKATLGILVLAVVAGLGTFFVTRGAGQDGRDPQRPPVACWLELSPEQEQAVREADPDFQTQAAAMAGKLASEQERLTRLLENHSSGREEIMAQVETVMVAHNSLERRVAEHVLDVREHLTVEQQKRLMGLMAQGVRRTRNRMQRGCGSGLGLGRGRHGGGYGQGQGRRRGGG